MLLTYSETCGRMYCIYTERHGLIVLHVHSGRTEIYWDEWYLRYRKEEVPLEHIFVNIAKICRIASYRRKHHLASVMCYISPENQHDCVHHPLRHQMNSITSPVHHFWRNWLICAWYLFYSRPVLLTVHTGSRIKCMGKYTKVSNDGDIKVKFFHVPGEIIVDIMV